MVSLSFVVFVVLSLLKIFLINTIHSGTLIIGPLLGQEKVVRLARWSLYQGDFKYSKTESGRLKSGLFIKVVRLPRS